MSDDAIDLALGLAPGDRLHALRRLRPEFVAGAQACRAAVLHPAGDNGLSTALRAALGARMARANADAVLAGQYDALTPAAFQALAQGEAQDALPPLQASLARHADLVTREPAAASAADLTLLREAGLTNPQIVALSELIAFVNYQTRIAQGLRLLGGL
jgi:uncharacterized protein YciW